MNPSFVFTFSIKRVKIAVRRPAPTKRNDNKTKKESVSDYCPGGSIGI